MTAAVPRPADVRIALRRVRRGHSDRTLGDLLIDVYLLAFIAVLYGGGAGVSIQRHLAQPITGAPAEIAVRGWLVLALLLTGGALAWRMLRAIGPLVTTPPAQSWVLATPVDRAGWVRLPFAGVLVLGGVLGTALGLLAGWAAGSAAVWAAVAGAGFGVTLIATAVAVQPYAANDRRWANAALGAGLLLAVAVLIANRREMALSAPPVPAVLVTVLAVVVAVIAVRYGRRTLPRLSRAALGGGAQLTGTAVTAVLMLDPSLLSGILTNRRWRQAGTVHSRHLRPGPRWLVLLQADLVRQLRRRSDLLTYVGLALVPYLVAVFAPVAVGSARIIAGYLAADRLAGGLRSIARTPSLRRLLGGSDRELKLVHLIAPAAGLLPWWYVTDWAVAGPPSLNLVLVAGIIAAVYRTATRPPMTYDSGLADSPLGPIPTTLIRRLVRGPDLVAVLVLIDLFLTIGRR